MKSDLDRLMEERQIDVVMTLQGENEDPIRTYLSNGVDFAGFVIKKRGEDPVLITNPMERDEAAKSGLRVYTWDQLGYGELLREIGEDGARLLTTWYQRIFDHFEIEGRVNIYGIGDINAAYRALTLLGAHMEGRVTFGFEAPRKTIFDEAYETKDAQELARLREVAARTSAVVRATRDWLARQRAGDGLVLRHDHTPLTIGDVKRHVRRLLLDHDLEDTEGMIFAQGRDAGVPHSHGDDQAPLRLGESIVFDLFPREPKGYYHDMTRTWCVGHVPETIAEAYATVMEAFKRSVDMCSIGTPTSAVQRMVCEFFEERGHPTVLNTPGTTDGYVHSLAHGLGLNVHEAPYFPTYSESYKLKPGNVFTIEPGLYYPERGYGVRVEDTVVLHADNSIETLTDVPYDLLIELES